MPQLSPVKLILQEHVYVYNEIFKLQVPPLRQGNDKHGLVPLKIQVKFYSFIKNLKKKSDSGESVYSNSNYFLDFHARNSFKIQIE